MAVYKTLSDEIVADEVADQQARPRGPSRLEANRPGAAPQLGAPPRASPPRPGNTTPACHVVRRVAYSRRFLPLVQTKDAVVWIREMLDYNVPLGKLNRGLAVLDGA